MLDGCSSEAYIPRFPIREIVTVREGANGDAEELLFTGGACGSCGTAAVVGSSLVFGLLFKMCLCVEVAPSKKEGKKIVDIAKLRGS